MTTPGDWRRELDERRDAFRGVLTEQECDAGLVFAAEGHPQSFRYLTGFAPVLGDMWCVLGANAGGVCALNFDWQLDEARECSGIDDWRGALDAVPHVVNAVKTFGARRLGVAGLDRLPKRAADALAAAVPGLELVDLDAQIGALRRRKSPLEVELLREACRITDEAFAAIRAELEPGRTEKEIAALLALSVQRAGGEWAFAPQVIAGRQAVMIREPSTRRLEVCDAVMIDIGVAWQGYLSDASRTFVVGPPSSDQLRIWDVVCRAHEAAMAATRPGAPCRAVQEAGARVITEAGYGLRHRIGHGIGLGLSFEWPDLANEGALLEPGVTICIEPGIYANGAGALKLEDDVLVTADGCELLTHAAVDL